MEIPIHYLTSTTSTNDEIVDILQNNPVSCSVYTFNQIRGRGQYGNQWQSAPFKNLAYSLAIPTKFIALPDSLFNYHTAIIVRNFIANLTANDVKIKWPNDLILHQKKICGMLIEKRKISHEWFFILGIGINILQEEFLGLPKAGSILTQTKQHFDLKYFTISFHQFVTSNIFIPKSVDDILFDFNKHLFRKDMVSIFEKETIRQNGIIKNADADGFIWVNLEKDGLKRFYHKEIELLY